MSTLSVPAFGPVHLPGTVDKNTIVFVDAEVSPETGRIVDLGACWADGRFFHSSDPAAFKNFCKGAQYVCGHNIVAFDMPYLRPILGEEIVPVDTLPLSALLFPRKRFHKLLKDEKLLTDELNNPLSDARKAMALFEEEVTAFGELPGVLQRLFCAMLRNQAEFKGFFRCLNVQTPSFADPAGVIKRLMSEKLCIHADLDGLSKTRPAELAYALAFIRADEPSDVIPPWVNANYPAVQSVLNALRYTPCQKGCPFCREHLCVKTALKRFFGFDAFRTYDGEPLQEKAAQAAVGGESLLAVFPTGGGKSITFQLPALMEGELTRALTVVISPLQSLMKDQVDNLIAKGIGRAVAINGLLNPIERSRALEAVISGEATILYLAPESLRSRSILAALQQRRVTRFVIDEAHCFSVWGHDFRVDYLFIADFIKKLEESYDGGCRIAVSCFTATAKQKVIQDICDYFKEKLGLNLRILATSAQRKNLSYRVIHVENEADRYVRLRELIEACEGSAIVYVATVNQTRELAAALTEDGLDAVAFAGRMDTAEKSANQDLFLSGQIKTIIATNAFGMGVDKKDVRLVVHYNISASLENYVQESGRAGRDEAIQAQCCILFNEEDLNTHFSLLRRSKLTQADIQMVWSAIKSMRTKRFAISPLELARRAGLECDEMQLESKVKNAVAALEIAGYVRRSMNAPRVYATSVAVDSTMQARRMIEGSPLFAGADAQNEAVRIVTALISARSGRKTQGEPAESRTDWLADRLGLSLPRVVSVISNLRQIGVLHDHNDMSASVKKSSLRQAGATLASFQAIESLLIKKFDDSGRADFNLKELNNEALAAGIDSSLKKITTIVLYLRAAGLLDQIRRSRGSQNVTLLTRQNRTVLEAAAQTRADLCAYIVETLKNQAERHTDAAKPDYADFSFSAVRLLSDYRAQNWLTAAPVALRDIENALLMLHRTGIVSLAGGFMISYQGMTIERLELDNKRRYRKQDYVHFSEHYRQKVQQVHIVGRYANLMLADYAQALQYVRDYFELDYQEFLDKYFAGTAADELNVGLTASLRNRIFGELSEKQREIIDEQAQFAVVAAGPGSGKTRVLVHKLASLLVREDVRSEQLLMLTFSRAAATEFKRRLIDLVGKGAYFVDIKTFHSFAFDVLGRYGSLEESEGVIELATREILSGDAEPSRISKTVLVIDEAQDMDDREAAMVEALIERNEAMRVIAVGDDDQNIYAFRGAAGRFMQEMIVRRDAVRHEMVENYRSAADIVAFSNAFVTRIQQRLKSHALTAVRSDSGSVRLISHTGESFEAALIEGLMQDLTCGRLSGSCAVLAGTNEEAFTLCAMLRKTGVPVSLIQANKSASLINLAEVRALLKYLTAQTHGERRASVRLFEEAEHWLKAGYGASVWTENVLRLVHAFTQIEQPDGLFYLADFEEFVRESRLEDTFERTACSIVVSTIHKAKGREFDHVYVLFKNRSFENDDARRRLYVAMTRAKTDLTVHYRGALLSQTAPEIARPVLDENIYEEPDELMLTLTHEDVWLSYFVDKKRLILSMRAGAALTPIKEGLTVRTGTGIVRLVVYSKAFQARLAALRKQGYEIVKAEIGFIVAWREKPETPELAVVLPTLHLKRTPNR